MNRQPVLIALTVVNFALLVALALTHIGGASASGEAAVLRGRSLQIVDAQGRVRVSLEVLAPKVQANGEMSAETVLLRMITEKGRPSVKIAASEQAAGMSLAGPTGTNDTYMVLEAKGTTSSIRLRNEDGREQVLSPTWPPGSPTR